MILPLNLLTFILINSNYTAMGHLLCKQTVNKIADFSSELILYDEHKLLL
jgi:hypothetical protein